MTSRPHSQRSSVAGLHEILSPPQRGRENFPAFSPRESTRPPPRDLKGILAGSDDEEAAPARSPSPKRKNPNLAKSGAGKNYHANRLFEEETPHFAEPSPERKQSNARHYSHFDLGGEEDAPALKSAPTLAKTANKHASQWDFADFATPEKVAAKTRQQDVRHIDWDQDEDVSVPCLICSDRRLTYSQGEVSPVRRPVVHHERPDARAHFEITDDLTPVADKHPNRTHKGMGLYQSTMRDDGDDIPIKGALSDLSTNPNVKNRHKDFDSSWEMTDKSPSLPVEKKISTNGQQGNEEKRKDTFDSSWGLYDDSPGRKENNEPQGGRGIKVGGNGMGGRKDVAKNWVSKLAVQIVDLAANHISTS